MAASYITQLNINGSATSYTLGCVGTSFFANIMRFANVGNTNAINATNNSNSYPTLWIRNTMANSTTNSLYVRSDNGDQSHPTIWAQQDGGVNEWGFYTTGNIGCDGAKSACIVIGETADKKDIKVRMIAIEAGQVWLEHIDSGESNKLIEFHPIFKKTISIENYKVFITPTSATNSFYVLKEANGFTVISDENFSFDYRITARRIDQMQLDYRVDEMDKNEVHKKKMEDKMEEQQRVKMEKITLKDGKKGIVFLNSSTFLTEDELIKRKDWLGKELESIEQALVKVTESS